MSGWKYFVLRVRVGAISRNTDSSCRTSYSKALTSSSQSSIAPTLITSAMAGTKSRTCGASLSSPLVAATSFEILTTMLRLNLLNERCRRSSATSFRISSKRESTAAMGCESAIAGVKLLSFVLLSRASVAKMLISRPSSVVRNRIAAFLDGALPSASEAFADSAKIVGRNLLMKTNTSLHAVALSSSSMKSPVCLLSCFISCSSKS
mmetsp:Transcript_1063/g.2537  ORF Transcript_1063/g.2537 Transcript_1063/m.2537 type:complete len:207 (-) Transcript_1063:584-1204(-)